MLLKPLLTAAFAATLFMMPATAKAQVEHYDLETVHTQILFFVDHLGFSKSMGKFHEYQGHIVFDRDNPENSSVDVTIETASISMGLDRWDDHMKNEDFFDVEQYPQMTFRSTHIEVTGEDTANITGDLTLLGQTHPVTLDVVHNKSAENRGRYMSGFSATTTINRSQWGMTYGLPAVGDEVEIRLEVEAIRRDGDTEVEAAE